MMTMIVPSKYGMRGRPLKSLWGDWFDPFIPTVECEDWLPASDFAETEKAYMVSMELPGIDITKIEVSFEDGVLTVKGEKTKETTEGENCDCAERYYGSFERILRISEKVDSDKIDATYKDGILKLTIPKAEGTTVKKILVH
jgi:HSP20 family protein